MTTLGCWVFYWDEVSLQCSLTNPFVSPEDPPPNHIAMHCISQCLLRYQQQMAPNIRYGEQKLHIFKLSFQSLLSQDGDVSGAIVLPVSDPDKLIHICPPSHSLSHLSLSLPSHLSFPTSLFIHFYSHLHISLSLTSPFLNLHISLSLPLEVWMHRFTLPFSFYPHLSLLFTFTLNLLSNLYICPHSLSHLVFLFHFQFHLNLFIFLLSLSSPFFSAHCWHFNYESSQGGGWMRQHETCFALVYFLYISDIAKQILAKLTCIASHQGGWMDAPAWDLFCDALHFAICVFCILCIFQPNNTA